MSERRKPYVYVTLEGPDDGGDFGPHTLGTRTSGIKEALDYAHENCRDVYIFGGRGGLHAGVSVPDNVYTLDETLRVPWSQDLKLDGGNYVLRYMQETGDAVVIDSQMNCRYKFGLIVCESDGAAVRIKPETPGPDDFVVVTASEFDFSAVVAKGTGIVIDASEGSIINSRILAEETNTQGIGVHIADAGGGHRFSNNIVHVMYTNQYHATGVSTGLRVGDPGCDGILYNRFETSLHAPRGAYFDEETKRYTVPEDFTPPENAIGADIFAQSNQFSLTFYGKRAPGSDVVFEPEARDNTVFVFNLPNGVTNRATVPNNRVVPNWPIGFGLATPPVPVTGTYAINTTSYLVQILIVDPGDVREWTVAGVEGSVAMAPFNLSLVESIGPRQGAGPVATEACQTISAGLTPGQTIILEPGERIKLEYERAPRWRWKALR